MIFSTGGKEGIRLLHHEGDIEYPEVDSATALIRTHLLRLGPAFCRQRKCLEVFSCLPYNQPQVSIIWSLIICWQVTKPYSINQLKCACIQRPGKSGTGGGSQGDWERTSLEADALEAHSYGFVHRPQHRWLWNGTFCPRNRVCVTYLSHCWSEGLCPASKSHSSDHCYWSTPTLFQPQRNKTHSSSPLTSDFQKLFLRMNSLVWLRCHLHHLILSPTAPSLQTVERWENSNVFYTPSFIPSLF